MAKSRILIIEDDPDLAQLLAYNVGLAGYDALVATDGLEGVRQAQAYLPDLVLLDVMLPSIDGFEVCRRLRSIPSTSKTLVMMVTARSEESDQVTGLALGADDYVTKPFSVRVLMERIRALERRARDELEKHSVVSCQGIKLDRRSHQAWAEEEPLSLTLCEFRLLEILLRQPGRVFRRPELIDGALGGDALVLERTIDAHVRGLRVKLGLHADKVETVRGVGYRFRKSEFDCDGPIDAMQPALPETDERKECRSGLERPA